MPLKIEKMAESELNMTPMIDIVFQLILFFLFNLRFKSMDYRIESALPKDRGVEATPQMVEPIPSIKISLFRLDADNPDAARTKIKIGTVHEVVLPVYKWKGKRVDDMAVEKLRDAKYTEIANVIKRLREGKPEFKGEIDTPLVHEERKTMHPISREMKAFAGCQPVDVAVAQMLRGIARRDFEILDGPKPKLTAFLARYLPTPMRHIADSLAAKAAKEMAA